MNAQHAAIQVRSNTPDYSPQWAGHWVCGSELGVSSRRVNQLYHELRGLGVARKEGKLYWFERNHPTVSALVTRARHDASYANLDGFTAKQIDKAREWKEIIETSRVEIARFMRERYCGRRLAVEWFCKHRAPELDFGVIAIGTFDRRVKAYEGAGDYKLRSQIDTRGGKTGKAENCAVEAWDYFKTLYLDDRKLSIRLCFDLTASQANKSSWAWPSYQSVCQRIQRDIPEPSRVLFREGEKAYKSKCVPRVRRTYDHLAAGEHWCADEHTMDLYARTPDGKGGWKRCRPLLTAWLDIRSRMFVGWHIGARANSDTILAAFKKGVKEYGPPVEVTCDNGADYKAAAGRKKKWTEFDQERLANVYSELGITTHWAIPYEPQAKMIESHFRAVCGFAKLFDSYCGNKPDNRPESAMEIKLWHLPTIDEVREQFAAWLEAHHAKPQTGDAMFNLAPVQAMEQFRGNTIRQIPTDAFLEFICSKIVGPVKVTKDGVRHQGIHYGQGNDELYRLQGQQVLLRVHPERADYVDVCDLQSRPLTRAMNERLTGVTQDDVRQAMSRRKKAMNVAKEARKTSRVLLHTPVSGAIAAQRERAIAAQEATAPPDPPAIVQAVRPDIASDVDKVVCDAESKAVQSAGERRAKPLDLAAFNAIAGIDHWGRDAETEERKRPSAAYVDAILSGRAGGCRVDDDDEDEDDDLADILAPQSRGVNRADEADGDQCDDDDPYGDEVASILTGKPWRADETTNAGKVNDGDDGAEPVDVFDVLGRRTDERKRA
jgi:transposase InsO family protein